MMTDVLHATLHISPIDGHYSGREKSRTFKAGYPTLLTECAPAKTMAVSHSFAVTGPVTVAGPRANGLLFRPPCFFFGREALNSNPARRTDAAPFPHDPPIAEKIYGNLHAVKAPPVFWRVNID